MLPREEEHYLHPLSFPTLLFALRMLTFAHSLSLPCITVLHYCLPYACSPFRRSTPLCVLSSSTTLSVCVLSCSPFFVHVLSRRSVEDDISHTHVIPRHVYILDSLIDRLSSSLVIYTQVFTPYSRRKTQIHGPN